MVTEKCGTPAKVTHTISLEEEGGNNNVSDKNK
jgi:hypothetical protein